MDTILYLKAKSVNKRPKLLTSIYIILRLAYLAIWIKLIVDVKIFRMGKTVNICTSLAKSYEMLILIVIETMIIMYLTILFLNIIYVQYKESPRAIYSFLIKDGLIFSLSICLFYFFITILKFTNVMGHKDLFSIGWVVSCKLMTEQIWRSHLWRSEGRKSSETTQMNDLNVDLAAIEIK
ncbi:hypothetical protein K493DRAFT_295957 [Basidiobolus meristosporus CBS 931.73]|uniref:G-protein coupled receptors family 3 profile domain-containing protein n=1 Tax=Basidiobolus meristosporus CBS 931.73 TaxID=1314790 RepID=A0A1Y1Z8P6_9FUNG|nr:hypothetical protein K493DRAFT_295957 [Basidiobolus meristosporus CBS 931.73]|eukprot:ORY06633.1 hypothetical protein K493DRAFT_295957 [Basidiobolus meristosporus CBS 931.73]